VLNEVLKTGSEVNGANLNLEAGNEVYRGAFIEAGSGSAEKFNYYVGSNLFRTSP